MRQEDMDILDGSGREYYRAYAWISGMDRSRRDEWIASPRFTSQTDVRAWMASKKAYEFQVFLIEATEIRIDPVEEHPF